MKTKQFLLSSLFLVLFVNSALSQETNSNKAWFLGINVSPSLAYRTFFNEDGSSSSTSLIKTLNSFHIKKFSVNGGLKVGRRISKVFVLESGIQFADNGYKAGPFPTTSVDQPDGDGSKAFAIVHFQNIGIPLRILYNSNEKQNHMLASMGFLFTQKLLYYQSMMISSADGSESKRLFSIEDSETSKLNKNLVFFIFSSGYQFQLNHKIDLQIEPTMTYSLSNLFKTQNNVSQHLWNIGVNLQLNYTLN